MTSMYGTPGPSMYLPAAPAVVETFAASPQVMAAPTVVETIAAPTVVAAAPSYVAAPVVEVVAPAPVVEVVAPAGPVVVFGVPPPTKLTEGLVPPEKVEVERVAYEK